MGLIDDVQRLAAEPPTLRRRRRIGAFFLALGVVLCIASLFSARWWTLDYSWGTVAIGLTESEACNAAGCSAIDDDEVLRVAGAHNGRRPEDLAALRDWLGTRTAAAASMIVLAAVSALLVLWSFATPARRGTRSIALLVLALAVIALACVSRFVLETPVDVMTRGTHAYLGFVALADLLVGIGLVLASSSRSSSVPITP